MSESDALLLRARLHIRAGKKLLDHGKLVHGIGTLYDAVENAIRWKYRQVSSSSGDAIPVSQMYTSLEKNQIFTTSTLSFSAVEHLMEESLAELPADFDAIQFWEGVKALLTDLEVFPFPSDAIPPEDDQTRKVLDIEDDPSDPDY